MPNFNQDLGPVTAYGIALEHGYPGTEEQWAQDQANAGKNAAAAKQSADNAAASANTAKQYSDSCTQSVTDSKKNADNAANSAAAAKQSADTFTTDTTLRISGKAADSKATGDGILALLKHINDPAPDISKIQKIVQAGYASDVYPVGTVIPVNHTTHGTHDFIVLGHDINKKVGNPEAHTMTIGSVPALFNAQFDAPEAMYVAETAGLDAGVYSFNNPVKYGDWEVGDFQFTLSKPLPINGQICFTGYAYGTPWEKVTVSTFPSSASTEAIETKIAITAGKGGTFLGTLGTELNHQHRVSYGSNNYAESAMRQMLNSDKEKGTFWQPKTKYDRPPSWVGSMDGFMKGLDSDFLAAICPCVVKCSTNGVYESPDSQYKIKQAYELNDTFFLLSSMELGVTGDIPDNSVMYPFYQDAVEADRIKYSTSGSACYWWLRSAYQWNSCGVRHIYPSGAWYSVGASVSRGVAPACIIG